MTNYYLLVIASHVFMARQSQNENAKFRGCRGHVVSLQ